MSFAELVAEVKGLSNDALDDRRRSIERRQRELDAERAAVLAESDERKRHAVDGHATIWGLLRAELGWSDGECRTRMRIARLVDTFPDVGDSLYEAQVPVAHVAEIARAHSNPRCGDRIEEVIGHLVNEAARFEHRDFRVIVQRWELLADIDGAHRDREESQGRRHASFNIVDGVGELVAQFGDVASVQIQEIFERFRDAELLTDWEECQRLHGDDACPALMARTNAQRAADAVLAVFQAAASAAVGAQPAEPVVNLVIDQATFVDMLTELELLPERFREVDPLATQRRCETTTGELVDPYAVVAAALEGRIRRVVCDRRGVIVDQGRTRRLFTGKLREAVTMLTPRCIWPGCHVRSGRCQADHLEEWASDHGHTRTDNGAVLCGRHNRWKHRGYTVRRDATGHWLTYRPDGTLLT
jgi:hypothetical protein